MSDNDRNSTIKTVAVVGAVAGIAGYVAGLLTAPKSGKETRGDIKKAANESIARAERELKKLNGELSKLISEAKVRGDKLGSRAKGELNDLVAKAKDSKEKVREVISAIHQGDADDRDLKNAVNDAKTAIDHLGTYLKK